MVKKSKKIRADQLLVDLGYAGSLDEARRMVMSGEVRLNANHLIRNGSELVSADVGLLVQPRCPYVSRGAYKLKPALEKYLPDLTDFVTLDVGASTGGFTDLMLQLGAVRAYTVDVGRGQLHGKLRNDGRVVCHEQVNARALAEDFLPEKVDVAVTDVSFISVKKVMPSMNRLAKSGAWFFVLVKPQFEAARGEVLNGVVTDESIRARCTDEVVEFGINQLGWMCVDRMECPIKGPKGNLETIVVFRSGQD